MNVPSPVRRWVYSVLAAVAVVAVAYGWLNDDQTVVWLALVQAVLVVPSVEVARSRVTPVPKDNTNEQNPTFGESSR